MLASFAARAGLFIEPSVGYTTGLLSQSGVPGISTQTFIFGGRVGYQFVDFKFGADYSMGLGSGKQMGDSATYKPTDLGFFLGYELPLSLKAYGSVFLDSKTKIQPTENPSYFSGRSFRLGIGLTALPLCSIIFEGTYRIYSKYNGVGLTKSIKGTTWGGSLSFSLP